MPGTFPETRLRRAGLSADRVAALRAEYDASPAHRQQTLRGIYASATDDTLRKVYDPDGQPESAGLTPEQLTAAHDTDPEREGFIPARLSAANVVPADSDHSVTLRSPTSRTADTVRLRVVSYQKQEPENQQNGGEGVWLDLADPRAKNMLTWRLAMDKVARTVRPVGASPSPLVEADMQRIVWVGAHHYAQDQTSYASPTDVHGHWSVEVPDTGLALRTRLEVRYVGPDGKVGADKTLVQTASADLVVDASNGQVLRLRSGQGAEKAIEWANTEWGDASKRWRLRTTGTESGTGNAGSDLAFARYADAGTTVVDEPLAITRSSGRVHLGGATGSAGGATVRRNSAGQALTVETSTAGATAIGFVPADAASRLLSSSVQTTGIGVGEATARFVAFADGKHEWGAGGSTARDVNLYRKSADVLATDDDLEVTANGKGVLLHSPDGARWRLTVSNAGAVTAIAAP
jgi:hypothetical protein